MSSLEVVVVSIPLETVLRLRRVMLSALSSDDSPLSSSVVASGLASSPAMVTCSRPIANLVLYPVTGRLSVPRLAANLIPWPVVVLGLLAAFLVPWPVLGLLAVFLVSRPHVDGLWCEACLEVDM